MFRIDAGEDRGHAGAVHQFRIVHGGDFCAGNDAAHGEADFEADLFCQNIAIAGKDLDLYAQLVQIAYGFACGCFGRVEKDDKPKEGHVVLLVFCIWRGLQCDGTGSDRKDAKTVGAELLVAFGGSVNKFGRKPARLTVLFAGSGYGQYVFRCAFGYQKAIAQMVDHNTATLAFIVKWNLVYLCVRGNIKRFMFCDGIVERTFDARMERAGNVRMEKDGLIYFAEDIQIIYHDDLVFGKRAGLVGAKYGHAAEVLNCRQMFYDDVLFCHSQRTAA